MKPPSRRRLAWQIAAGAAAVLFGVALIAGAVASRPSSATVDGKQLTLEHGTTVADLRDAKTFVMASGDLIGVDGSVLLAGAGFPSRVLRNGRAASDTERVYGGDVLVSRPGNDRRESVITTEVAIPFDVEYVGTGPMSEVRTAGHPGVRKVTMGMASGIEVTSTVIAEPVKAVIVRVQPPPGAKLVALTFDDGPWPGQTDEILDILREKKVRATFFMLGVRVKRAPQLAKRVANEGHLVANHTSGHRNLAASSAKVARKQIQNGRATIRKYTGVDTPWLRPPYGAMDKGARKVAKSTNSRVVMWDVDSHDWEKKRSWRKISRSVVRSTDPGEIILMHDGGGDRARTIKALPVLIDKLQARGYTFVTIDELYAAGAAK